MINFYDTNALFSNSFKKKTNNIFIISNLTLKELENIKTDPKKDLDIKYKARKVINWLMQNEQRYHIIQYNYKWDRLLKKYPTLSDNTDSRIILTALTLLKKYPNLKFITYDSNCACLAKNLGINTQYQITKKQQQYTGYRQIICKNEAELANFYTDFKDLKNPYNLLQNQYIIIKDSNNKIISTHKYTSTGYKDVTNMTFNSKMFGKIKAKDIYQQFAMDSMLNNTLTVVRGPAGAGKSLLSLGYLFEKLEKGKIDKIVIFCNTVATQGSAKLGYYPGSRDQKLLDSQIGNFLVSKLGNKIAVQQLIEKNQLVLLPMSDIRGFDTSGMHAGIYITQAQNMSIDLMKLALQRVGQDSIVILDGDTDAQVDLGIYSGHNNGLRRVSEIFKGTDVYGECTLVNIYRSKIANIAQQM